MSQQQHSSYIYIKNTVDGKRFKFVSKTEIRNLSGARIHQFLTAGAGIRFPYQVTFNGRVIQATDVLRDIDGVDVGSTLVLEALQQEQQQSSTFQESSAAAIGDVGDDSPRSNPSSKPGTASKQQRNNNSNADTDKNSFAPQATTWLLIRNPSDNNKKYKFVSRGNVQDLTGARVKQFLFAAASIPEEQQVISFNGNVIGDKTVLRDAGVEMGSTLIVSVVDVQEQFRNAIAVASAADQNNNTTNLQDTNNNNNAMQSTFMQSVGGHEENTWQSPGAAAAASSSPGGQQKTSLLIKYPEVQKTYKFVSSHNVYELTGQRVKTFVEAAAGVEPADQVIRFRGLVLGDSEALADIGIHPGAVLTLEKLPAQEAIRKFWYTHDNQLESQRPSQAVAEEMVMGSMLQQKEKLFAESYKELQAKVVRDYLPLQSDAADPLLKFKQSVSATVALETVVNLPESDDDEHDEQQQQQQEETTPEKQLQYLLNKAAEEEDPSAYAQTVILEDHEHALPLENNKPQHYEDVAAAAADDNNNDDDDATGTAFLSQRRQRKFEKQQRLFLDYEARRRTELTVDHHTLGLLRIVSELEDDIRGSLVEAEDRWFQRNIFSDDAIIMAKLHTQARVRRRVDAKERLDAAVEAAKEELEQEYQRELQEARDSDFAVLFRRAANKAHEYLRDETHMMFQTGKTNALAYFGIDDSTAAEADISSGDASRVVSATSPTRRQQMVVGEGEEHDAAEESSVVRAERRAVQLARQFTSVSTFLQ